MHKILQRGSQNQIIITDIQENRTNYFLSMASKLGTILKGKNLLL